MTFLIALLLTLPTSVLHAHPLDMGLLNITETNEGFDFKLALNPTAAANLIGVETNVLPEKTEDFFKATLSKSTIACKKKECSWEGNPSSQLISPQNLTLNAKTKCSEKNGSISLELPFLQRMAKTFKLVTIIDLKGSQKIAHLGPDEFKTEIAVNVESPGFFRFVEMGLEHIGVTPNQWMDPTGFHLPYGIDHILFVVSLLLGGGSFMVLLKVITGFTIGHTLSLTLATFGLVQVSAHWTEALIALTISYVALENVLQRKAHNRWMITIGIGLIHGLGFASALADLHLTGATRIGAVLGFNIGVELGQAIVILPCFPLILLIKKWRHGDKFVLIPASAFICALSFYWFIRRI